MLSSRRQFVRSAAGAAALGMIPAIEPVTAEAKSNASPQDILALFKSLPGDVAVKIHAPATNGKPEFLVESNAARVLFVGSAFKSFVLCEALRQADAPDVSRTTVRETRI